MNITLNLSKSFGKNYSELYKDTTGSGAFARLNPYTAGSFSISFISVKHFFRDDQPDFCTSEFSNSAIFRRLENKSRSQRITQDVLAVEFAVCGISFYCLTNLPIFMLQNNPILNPIHFRVLVETDLASALERQFGMRSPTLLCAD